MGIKGKDFVVLCADMTNARSILAYKHDENKIAQLDTCQLLACAGDNSSRVAFTEYIEKHLALMKLRSGRPLSNIGASNFIRTQLAEALRSRGGAYQVSSLFASVDDKGADLYYMDYLGTLMNVPFAAHGYGATFVTSQMDAQDIENMDVKQVIGLVHQCCDQLALRYLINLPKYCIKILTKDGVEELEPYRPTFSEPK